VHQFFITFENMYNKPIATMRGRYEISVLGCLLKVLSKHERMLVKNPFMAAKISIMG